MSLTWTGFGIDNLIDEFVRSTTKTRRDSKKVMREGSKKILEASKQMAPVDEHRLEQAHELAVTRLNKDDMEVVIAVGGVVDGVDVDEYAWVQHERLAPAGDLQPGEKSLAKSVTNPAGRYVGGKFLDRAVDELEPSILEALAATLPGD